MSGQVNVKKPFGLDDSLVFTQTAYPPADILAEVGRVTVSAARVDRQMALALHDFPGDGRSRLELLKMSSASLRKELKDKIRMHLARRNLLDPALEDVENAYSALKQRHRVIHSIWSLSTDAAQVSVRDLARAKNEDEINRLLVRDVDAPESWSTEHPRASGEPGIEELAELQAVRASLEDSILRLQGLRHELRELRRGDRVRGRHE